MRTGPFSPFGEIMDFVDTLAHTSGLIGGPRPARLLGYEKKNLLAGPVRFNPQAVAVWLLASQLEVK